MLSRKFRATRKDIEDTIKTGITISKESVYAKISRHETERAGFAIVVSKKNSKTSVGRHMIKRKISSFIEENLKNINPNFKKTIVFFFKKTEIQFSYDETKNDVNSILKKEIY